MDDDKVPAGKQETLCAGYLSIDQMLVADECKLLIRYLDAYIKRKPEKNSVFAREIDDEEIVSLLQELCYHAHREVEQFFGGPLFLFNVGIRRWRKHENVQTTQPTKKAPYTHTAFVYLNDNFTDGQFYFCAAERITETLQCSTGRFVAFGSGEDYQHGMYPAGTGDRYMLHFWFDKKPPK